MPRVAEIPLPAPTAPQGKPARPDNRDGTGFSALIDDNLPASAPDAGNEADPSAKPPGQDRSQDKTAIAPSPRAHDGKAVTAADASAGKTNDRPADQTTSSDINATIDAIIAATLAPSAAPASVSASADGAVVTTDDTTTDTPDGDGTSLTDTLLVDPGVTADPGIVATGIDVAVPQPVAVVIPAAAPIETVVAKSDAGADLSIDGSGSGGAQVPTGFVPTAEDLTTAAAETAAASADVATIDAGAVTAQAATDQTPVSSDLQTGADSTVQTNINVDAAQDQAPITPTNVAPVPSSADDAKPAVAVAADTGAAKAQAAAVLPETAQPLKAPEVDATAALKSAESKTTDGNVADAKTQGSATKASSETTETPHKQAARSDRASDLAGASTDAKPAVAASAPPATQHHHAASASADVQPITTPISLQAVTPVQAQLTATVVAGGAAVPLDGLAVEISARAKSGKNRFDIRLDPPELGRIDVRLDIDAKGKVSSHVYVEKSETLDLLRRDAPQLQQALNDQGLKTGDSGLQFSLRDQSAGQNDQGEERRQTANLIITEDETVPPVIASRGYRPLTSAGGVDIRV